jgi:hypothetical protein
MHAVGDIRRVVLRVEDNIHRHRWSQRYVLIGSKFWDICIGVQNSLHEGVGVRKAVEAEVRSQVGVELTGVDVAELLDVYVKTFANLKTVRRPTRAVRDARFGQRVHEACSSYGGTDKVVRGGKTIRSRGWMSRRLFRWQPESEEEIL